MLDQITPLIITFNEAPNLRRTLERLDWAKRIVVVDSFSADETLQILRANPRVEVFQRSFESFATQCNFGLKQVTTEWVLSLDADYLLTSEFIDEIRHLREPSVDSFQARFKYCVFGKPLSGTLYPPRRVLYRRLNATYEQVGHAHRVAIQGKEGALSSYILHDDRKPLSRWITSQSQYSVNEALKLAQSDPVHLTLSDRIRKKKLLAPLFIFVYCLILKGGIKDGWSGLYYAYQRAVAEMLLSMRLIETEILGRENPTRHKLPNVHHDVTIRHL
jgi:glycosyltransferase involved in cell wall biosynthesis